MIGECKKPDVRCQTNGENGEQNSFPGFFMMEKQYQYQNENYDQNQKCRFMSFGKKISVDIQIQHKFSVKRILFIAINAELGCFEGIFKQICLQDQGPYRPFRYPAETVTKAP